MEFLSFLMYKNVLLQNTSKILRKLKKTVFIKNFYLSGGTALALQIGHRESEDLDFFNSESFNPQLIQNSLLKIGTIKDVQLDSGTLNCFLDNTKIQFLHYPYKLLKKKIEWEGIYISSVLDIACTKLLTISSRGSKKDFIDLYFLLKTYKLPFLFKKLEEKYQNSQYDQLHILKSLIYFEAADAQPSPKMHKEINWQAVKEELKKEVKIFKI